ncbi:unnamed protein product [Rotaria sordida]|uniref:AB hydrolase-1 domain-containing protein n=1 Tax=Rotaria sordida TaxID=392033 RepID=A0A814P8B0_9BILA|nr:unnamed protein product [Rotaria sordida]
MSSNPTSHFVIIPNRPIAQENGEINQGSLKLHYWEWQGHQPTILFCHAASFHGRYFRGHGRSQTHPPPYHVRWHGEDVLQFIETLNLNKDNLIGIGHSMGGYALIYAAAIASTRLFRSLLLFDPGIIPRLLYDMLEKLEKREPFSRWSKDILRNYCTYALDENSKLICNSEGEHSMYQSSLQTNSNIYPFIEQSKFIQDIPIHIVRSSFPLIVGQFDTSPTAPDLVKWFQKGRDTQMKNATHLFPMEQPELIIDFVKEMIKDNIRSQL